MKSKTGIILITGWMGFFISCAKDKGQPTSVSECSSLNVTYSSDIAGIITTNCFSNGTTNCHVSGSSFGDFTSYEGLKQKADKGTLKTRVIDLKIMPPSNPLSTENITKIQCWLDAGAPNN